ncbi:carbon-nitrogen hydrolase family protein [Pseudomonas sp. dw_358]|uniref:carbon-nitrogen hydrolase family protein n=1 Tax=Pseudomonas sp. dw_358 TaxID=2720083 RepID=UPI001BD395F5|nr:carbon-nitrogen hydrolase family protein [Pseudomonas sp. dw_358]
MRKLLTTSLLLAAALAAGSYGLWSRERPAGHYLSDLRVQLALNEGIPGERGNLLGVQPELFSGDYRSRHRLHLKLAAYLQQARQQGLLGPRTVVVLPEHIGTWLWAMGEKQELYDASQREVALQWLLLRNPLQFVSAWVQARGSDRVADTWLRMKATSMADNYQQLFGGLAKEFGVTLVAGSIVLPTPTVEQGRLTIGHGRLYNTSLVFGADGLALGQPQRELSRSEAQGAVLEGAGEQALQVIDTPAGRLGILLGADADEPSHYDELIRAGAHLIVVSGNSHGHVPETISHVGVALGGRLWDETATGHNVVGGAGNQAISEPRKGARLVNLWL